MLLSRENVPPQALPREQVHVPAFGADVIVQGMTLPQLLRFLGEQRRARTPLAGESPEQAAVRAGGELVPLLLQMCVLAADDLPVYSAAQWGAWSVQHAEVALDLWRRAMRLSGQAVGEAVDDAQQGPAAAPGDESPGNP